MAISLHILISNRPNEFFISLSRSTLYHTHTRPHQTNIFIVAMFGVFSCCWRCYAIVHRSWFFPSYFYCHWAINLCIGLHSFRSFQTRNNFFFFCLLLIHIAKSRPCIALGSRLRTIWKKLFPPSFVVSRCKQNDWLD